jgi:hypothetical protein
MKAKMTDRAEKLLLRELTEFVVQGHDAEKIVEQSIARGWRGLFLINNKNTMAERKPFDADRAACPAEYRHEYDAYLAQGWTGNEALNQIVGFDHSTRRSV